MFKILLNLKEKIKSYLVCRKFVDHNNRVFNNLKKNKKKNQILVEFNAFHPSHIAISYLSNVLGNKNNSEINAYFNYSIISSKLERNFLNKLKWIIGNYFSLKNFKIYRSFGVKNIFKPIITKNINLEAEKEYFRIVSQIKNKNDVLKIKLHGMLFGDLIYDTYVKSFKKETINIKDDLFKKLLIDFLKLYFFWYDYFENNNITAIIGVHTVYTYAVPLRIGINRNISAYAINPQTIYKLNSRMMRMYGDLYEYPEDFLKLPKALQIKGKNEAKNRLKKRLSGTAGIEVDLLTTANSAFSDNKTYKKIIEENSKKKILICTHDFHDAIHAYGELIFTDFYEWIDYLGKISNQTDYDWYIKNHPSGTGRVLNYQYYTKKIVNQFLKKYPKFKLIPDDCSHNQIIKEGIDFVLTCYGSVGVEYPLLDTPVINASKNNPHNRYNFNFHPQNLKEYEIILKNLDNLDYQINKEEIYEYYFMRHIFPDGNWLIENRKNMLEFTEGYDGLFTYKMYEYWLKNYNLKKHNKINQSINIFLDSNDIRININHTNNSI